MINQKQIQELRKQFQPLWNNWIKQVLILHKIQVDDNSAEFWFEQVGHFKPETVKQVLNDFFKNRPYSEYNREVEVEKIVQRCKEIENKTDKPYKPLEPLDAIRAREEREYQQRLFTYKKELAEIKDFLLNNTPISDRLREAYTVTEEYCMRTHKKEIKYEYQQFTGKRTGHICSFEGLVCEYLEGSWKPKPCEIKGNLGENLPTLS